MKRERLRRLWMDGWMEGWMRGSFLVGPMQGPLPFCLGYEITRLHKILLFLRSYLLSRV